MTRFPFLNVFGCFERWLRKAFYQLGHLVGSKPLPFLLIPLLSTLILAAVTVCSVMTGSFIEEDRVWYMYSPIDSPSHQEHAIAGEFFKDEGMKFIIEVGVMAKDGGDILREGFLEEAVDLVETIRYNLTLEVEGKRYRYEDICDRHCNQTDVLKHFAHLHRSERFQNSHNFKLTYPTFKFGLNYGDYYVGSLFVDPVLKENQRIQSVRILNLQFQSARKDELRSKLIDKFEMGVYGMISEYNTDPDHKLNMTAMSDGIISHEIRRNGIYCITFFIPSSILIFVFVLISSLRKDPIRTKPWEGFGGVTCPMLSIIFAFGLLFSCGLPFMVITMVTPFLIMAIGVDDCFIILHAWHKSSSKHSVPRRLAETMAEAGPSITITSLTNAFSFGVGALSPTPAIQVFCVFTATGIAIDFLFQITFFAAVMTLGGRREEEGKNGYLLCHFKSPLRSRQARVFPKKKDSKRPLSPTRSLNFDGRITTRVAVRWSNVIMHPATKFVVYFVLFGYWAVSGVGFSRMRVDMKSEKAILDDTPVIDMFWIHDNFRLAQGTEYNVFVNDPPDFTNRTQLRKFQSLLGDLENYPKAMGQNSTVLWYRNYLQYLSYLHPIDPDAGFYLELPAFLHNYHHYQNYVKLKDGVEIRTGSAKTNQPNIDRFVFTSAMRDIRGWPARTEAQLHWREVSGNYPEFNVTIYYPHSFYTDQQLTLLWVTCFTVIIALIVMFVICILFIPNFASVVCSTLALLSINSGVFGLLYFWGVNLDPISMATLLMAIGFSVDFTCHISYHYYKAEGNNPHLKLTDALTSIGWPMTQAGLSTLVGVITLFFSGSYMIITFAKTVILVVGLGLIHGLVIIPVVLTTFPYFSRLLPPNCAGGSGGRSHRSDEDTISATSSAISSSPTLSASSTPPSSGRWKCRVAEATGAFPQIMSPVLVSAMKRKNSDEGESPPPAAAELTRYRYDSTGAYVASAGNVWHRPATQIQKLVLDQKLSLPVTGYSPKHEEKKRKLSRTQGIQEEFSPTLQLDPHQALAFAKSL